MSEVPWPFGRCILCLNERELTLEHVIPRQIGGRLTARFLCKECNDELGHRIESRVRSDPSIQLASENLREQIPELATAIQAGEPYLALGPGRKVPGSFKDGRFTVRSAEQDDGSLVHPTSEAIQHLRRILSKRGLSGDEVEQRLEEFAEAPDNALVDLGVSVQAIRWGVEEIRPALEGPFISSAVLAKIAYEFLACHAGELVLEDRAKLAGLREAVLGESEDAIEVERMHSSEYRPLHGLAMRHTDHAVVHVCLFGWYVFYVHLRQIALAPPHFIYTCELDSGEEHLSVLQAETAG